MRRVVCAANRYQDILVAGARHFDNVMIAIMNEIGSLSIPVTAVWEQGFIDQHGVFMTREEAWKVAEAAGQIIRRVGGDGERLYSENLY